MNKLIASNPYFDVREVQYANLRWTYVDAHRVLLVVYGLTRDSGRLVLIRQYRPPIDTYVLSAPMGCFPDAPIEDLLGIAAREAESETGHRVLQIQHMIDFARSPGMTTETARCFVACYSEECTSQDLHPDEEIDVCYFPYECRSDIVQEAYSNGEPIDSSVLLCGTSLMDRLESLRQEVCLTIA